MNYYLKYRPQKINELDLTAVRETLTQTLSSKSFPHAWLFAGPKGTGKTSSARIVAKAINCLKLKDGPEPCGRCDSCQAITAGTALDVLEIDAASNRGIDDIRDLKDKIKLTPTSMKYKVYIIDEVHMLTREAFNALLKTLEEPPGHAVFILATTEPAKLPATVVSRCLLVKFNKALPAELLRSLKRVVSGEKLKIKDEKLTEIAKLSDGSFRDAVKLLEFPGGGNRLNLNELLELIYQKQAKAAIDWLQQAWTEGADPRQLLLNLIERLRGEWLSQVGSDSGRDAAKSLLQGLIEAAGDLKTCPIEALPLELAVVEWISQNGQGGGLPPPKPAFAKASTGKEEIASKWPQVVAAVRAVNFSLEALLKATEPVGFADGFLMIKVFYQFHKDRLEEERYRALVEQIASKVLVMPIRIKFFLSAKLTPSHDEDIIKTAEEVFGIEVSD